MRSTYFRKFWYGFSTVTALALLIAAVVLSTRLLPKRSVTTSPETSPSTALPGVPATPLSFSAQAAQEIILQRLPGSTVTHVELGISRGSLVYEVYLDTGDCYTVDAATGDVAQASTGSRPAGATQPGPAPVNALRAAELAVAKHPGSQVKRVELGTRNGALVYLVELDNGQTVSITAADILAGSEPATSVSVPDDEGEAGDNRGSGSQDGGRDDNSDVTIRPPDDQADESNRGGSAGSTSTPSPSSGPGGSDDRPDDGSGGGSGSGSDDRPDDGSGGGSGGSDDRPDDGSGGGSGGGSDDRPDDGSGGGSGGSDDRSDEKPDNKSDDDSDSGSGGDGKDEDGRSDKDD